MRIIYPSAAIPVGAAKYLQSKLSFTPARARQWTAQVAGYANWDELYSAIDRHHSLPDEHLSPTELAARREIQSVRLRDCLATAGLDRNATALLREWGPSSLRWARSRRHPGNLLTPTEKEVLILLLRDYRDKEIAETLRITVGTIQKHCASIRAKLGTNSRTGALALALHCGWIEWPRLRT